MIRHAAQHILVFLDRLTGLASPLVQRTEIHMWPDFFGSLAARILPQPQLVNPDLVSLDGQPRIQKQNADCGRSANAGSESIGKNYSAAQETDVSAMFRDNISQRKN